MGERTTDMYDPSSREDSISMFHSDNKGTYICTSVTFSKQKCSEFHALAAQSPHTNIVKVYKIIF